ncbi:hypothetical protein [Pseudomonas moorei]|uniref:hypothetical protein n=1 Tax=Pseudomonas moorei TaxID=395599 RepID=UPI001FF25069|nr:hypothetical protein [Pseudomonas moorei]
MNAHPKCLKTLSYSLLLYSCLAQADTCPNNIQTGEATFNLRNWIEAHGKQSLSVAQQAAADASSQDCGSVSNSEECRATQHLLDTVVSTLSTCLNDVSKKNAPNAQPHADTTPEPQPPVDSLTNPWGQKQSGQNTALTAKNSQGCPYKIHPVQGYFHKPFTYICIGQTTEKCDISGKDSSGVVLYSWRVVEANSCLHPAGWVDAQTREKNSLDLKNVKVNKAD